MIVGIEELTEELKASKHYIAKWRMLGMPYIKKGAGYYYDLDAVHEWFSTTGDGTARTDVNGMKKRANVKSSYKRETDTKELSKALGVGYWVISKWREKGLPHTKTGKLCFYNIEEVREWLKENGIKKY